MKRVLGLLVLAAAVGCKSSASGTKSDPEDGGGKAKTATAAASNIVGEEIEYGVGGTKMTGYLAYDDAKEGKRPGVLIVHEWWGHDDYARKRARMLAEMGYTAFALDMYGDGKKAKHPGDAKKFMMEVLNNMETGVERFQAAQKILESHETTDPQKTAAIGYCFGGGIVLHMARIGAPLKGVASFHGSLATKTPAEPGAVKAKVLVLHGEADPFVEKETIETFKEEMKAAGADLQFVTYPGAKHSFTNPAATERGQEYDLPLAYDEEADEKSWAELEEFLQEIFSE